MIAWLCLHWAAALLAYSCIYVAVAAFFRASGASPVEMFLTALLWPVAVPLQLLSLAGVLIGEWFE